MDLDYTLISTLISATIMLSGCNNSSSAADKVVDTAGINSVQISGDTSMIRLSTNEGQALSAGMTARPTGWLSGWFYNDCKPSGEMVIAGNKLIIKAQDNDWYDFADCGTYLDINLPKNSDVTIDQPAFKVDLQGQFANLNMDTKAADIALQGSAHSVIIRGDAFRAQLRFEDESKPELIDIAGRALDTTLSFPQSTEISYRINSKASLLDTKRKNDANANTKILISGDYARTVIR